MTKLKKNADFAISILHYGIPQLGHIFPKRV